MRSARWPIGSVLGIASVLFSAVWGACVTPPAGAQTADLWAVAGDAAGAVTAGTGSKVLFAGAGHATFLAATIPAIDADLRGCAYVDASLYFIVGDGGTILESTGATGSAFVSEASGVTADLFAVAPLSGRLVAVGASGTIVRSAALSGGGWTEVHAPVDVTLRGVAGQGTSAVAVGDGGTVLRADPYGSSWDEVLAVPSGGAALYAVATLTDDRFVAVGAGGIVLRGLANGQSWSLMDPAGEGDLYGVAVRPGASQLVVAVGADGAIFTSSDAGESWQPADSGVSRTLRSVTYTGADFLACGDHGTLLRSLDGLVWDDQTPAQRATWGAIKALFR
jgi:hypothetical protein